MTPALMAAAAWAQTAPTAPAPALVPALQVLLEQHLHQAWQQALPALAVSQGVNTSLQAQFNNPYGAATAPCPQGWEISTVTLHRLGRRSLALRCGNQRGSVVAQLHADATVWRLRTALPAGHVLTAQDVVGKNERITRPDDVLPQSAWLGLQLKAEGQAGHVLELRDVLRPTVVHKGELLEIRAHGEGVRVSVMGTATASAKLGETVTARNNRTGRLVKGQLIEPGVLMAAHPPRPRALQPSPAAAPQP